MHLSIGYRRKEGPTPRPVPVVSPVYSWCTPTRRPRVAYCGIHTMTRLTRCLLLGAGALVAGRSVPSASVVSLLAPQDPETGAMQENVACGADCENRQCEAGCTPQKFCLRDPCYEDDKSCVETPIPCPKGGDEFTVAMCFQDKTEDHPCPAERRAELCADLKGKVCADRLGSQHVDVQTPLEYKASHVKKGECVSILEGTEDEWCRKACTDVNRVHRPPPRTPLHHCPSTIARSPHYRPLPPQLHCNPSPPQP